MPLSPFENPTLLCRRASGVHSVRFPALRLIRERVFFSPCFQLHAKRPSGTSICQRAGSPRPDGSGGDGTSLSDPGLSGPGLQLSVRDSGFEFYPILMVCEFINPLLLSAYVQHVQQSGVTLRKWVFLTFLAGKKPHSYSRLIGWFAG